MRDVGVEKKKKARVKSLPAKITTDSLPGALGRSKRKSSALSPSSLALLADSGKGKEKYQNDPSSYSLARTGKRKSRKRSSEIETVSVQLIPDETSVSVQLKLLPKKQNIRKLDQPAIAMPTSASSTFYARNPVKVYLMPTKDDQVKLMFSYAKNNEVRKRASETARVPRRSVQQDVLIPDINRRTSLNLHSYQSNLLPVSSFLPT